MRSLTLVTPDDLALAEAELREAIDVEEAKQLEADLAARLRREAHLSAPAAGSEQGGDVEIPAFLLRPKDGGKSEARRGRVAAFARPAAGALASYLPFVALVAAVALAALAAGDAHAGSAWLLGPLVGAFCVSLAAPGPARLSAALGKLAAMQIAVSAAALSGLFPVSVEPSGFLAAGTAALSVAMAAGAKVLSSKRED